LSAWNNLATAVASKLERIQRKPAAPCISRFIPSCSLHLCLRIWASKVAYFTSWNASPWFSSFYSCFSRI